MADTTPLEQAVATYMAYDLDAWTVGADRPIPPTQAELVIRLAEIVNKIQCVRAILPDVPPSPEAHALLQECIGEMAAAGEEEHALYQALLKDAH